MRPAELPNPGTRAGQMGQNVRMELAMLVSQAQTDSARGGKVIDGTWTPLKDMLTAAVTALEATEAAP